MFQALKNKTVSFLWFGQILSAIGDEIYRVALMWLAVGLIGSKTGYLAATQSAALLTLSLVGGKWADRWDPLRTMIRVDVLRGLIVLVPVALHYFLPPGLFVLVLVAVSLSALSAFFDPALQTALPDLCPDPRTLQAANGVMSMTSRFARVIGPAIVGSFSTFIPIIHFFSVDALSFFASAFFVGQVSRKTQTRAGAQPALNVKFTDAITSGFRLISRTPGMKYVMFAKAVTSSTWNVAYTLGFALLVTEMAVHDVKAFSLVIAAYGTGNFSGALVFANVERKNPTVLMYSGYVLLGIGFILVGMAPTLSLVMIAGCLAAVGGPINDVAFIDLMQSHFSARDLTKVFRFRLAVETFGILVLMALTPIFLKFSNVHTLIKLCGLAILLSGVVGLIVRQRSARGSVPPPESPSS